MALTTLGYSLVPDLWSSNAQTSMAIDASAEKVAFIWRAAKTGSISAVEFRLGAVTLGDTLLVSLQDVDGTTGDPDGSADQSVTVVVADSDDNTWKRAVFGASRSVTRGDWVACVIAFNAYVAGNLNIIRDSATPQLSISYADLFTASWAKVTTGQPVLVVEYSDTSYAVTPGLLPGVSQNVAFASNTGTADEYALRFQFPFPVRAVGGAFYAALGATADIEMILYSGTSVLATGVWDATNQSGVTIGPRAVWFPATVELAANTPYYLSIRPTTTNAFTLRYTEVQSNAHLAQMPGGVECYMGRRLDQGAWLADITTQRPAISLLVDQFDNGAGGGSSGGVLVGGRLAR